MSNLINKVNQCVILTFLLEDFKKIKIFKKHSKIYQQDLKM